MKRLRRSDLSIKPHRGRLRVEALEDRRMLSVSAVGPEFQVNTYTTHDQSSPAVASDSDGDYVVAWWSYGQDGDGAGTYAQRYNAAGVAQGSEFQVNTYTTAMQGAPSVAMDADGDFVVAWQSNDQDGATYGVYAQRYNAAGVPQGSEFQVNTYTTSYQYRPSVAMDADGDFVVAWESYGQDGDDLGIYGQRYNSAGIAQGGEFQVNTYTTNYQTAPSVAMDADGDFVVAWQSYGQDDSSYGIYGQRYNAAGVAIGSEFQLNTYTNSGQYQPSVALAADGDFLVAWGSNGQDGSSYGIYAQRYNAAGVAQGSEFQVNTYTTNDQYLPSVAIDADGDFVVAWQSKFQDGDGYGVYAQRYNAAGVPQGSEFPVNNYTTSTQGAPSVAIDADGDFVVAWESYGQDGDRWGIFAQRYAIFPEIQVNTYTTSSQFGPSVAIAADGDSVLAWTSVGQDGDGYGIYAQRYNAAGVALGGEFQVNTYTTGQQLFPSVAIAADGDFVVAWHSIGQDGSDSGVYAQRYDAGGVAQGGEFQVNTYTTSSQFGPSVAMDADGDFVVSWQSLGQDGDSFGVYAQRYNAAGVAQGSEFQVNTYTTSSQSTPSVATDADGDFVVAWQSFSQDGSNYGVYAQRYDAAGVAQGSEFQVNTYTTSRQDRPSVAMDADGDFVVAWSSEGQDGSVVGVYAQRYFTPPPPATVTGRQLYYNNSAYDSLTPGAASAAQEYSALASDKSAYLPGDGTFSVANTSSYDKGINGVIVEITGAHGTLTPDDFTVRMSGQQLAANNTVSSWAAAPAPTVTVFSDTPVAGTDRVHLTWADGAITDRYLEVVVEGDDAAGGNNTNTGLATSDIFFFANKIGDDFTGGPTFGNTNTTDEINARNNQGVASLLPTNIYDFNRDFFVNSTDQLIARNNQGFLQWFSFSNPPAAPAPPGGDEDGSVVTAALAAAPSNTDDAHAASSAVASALTIPSLRELSRSASSSAATRPTADTSRAVNTGGSQAPPAVNVRLARANGKAADAAVKDLDLDEDLLESLLRDVRRAD